ncbi:MAG: hypothetical protein DHS20C10_01590 [marine bacterium B5-7]|nr:MAG: hypothetical protein DHS20C10_01590 [marine bacterium B5-7]
MVTQAVPSLAALALGVLIPDYISTIKQIHRFFEHRFPSDKKPKLNLPKDFPLNDQFSAALLQLLRDESDADTFSTLGVPPECQIYLKKMVLSILACYFFSPAAITAENIPVYFSDPFSLDYFLSSMRQAIRADPNRLINLSKIQMFYELAYRMNTSLPDLPPDMLENLQTGLAKHRKELSIPCSLKMPPTLLRELLIHHSASPDTYQAFVNNLFLTKFKTNERVHENIAQVVQVANAKKIPLAMITRLSYCAQPDSVQTYAGVTAKLSQPEDDVDDGYFSGEPQKEVLSGLSRRRRSTTSSTIKAEDEKKEDHHWSSPGYNIRN